MNIRYSTYYMLDVSCPSSMTSFFLVHHQVNEIFAFHEKGNQTFCQSRPEITRVLCIMKKDRKQKENFYYLIFLSNFFLLLSFMVFLLFYFGHYHMGCCAHKCGYRYRNEPALLLIYIQRETF